MRPLATYQHFFFDLDNTLTRSKSLIAPEHRSLLATFPRTVVVISGAHHRQIDKQLAQLPVVRMGQNGNHTMDHANIELWQDVLNEKDELAIKNHAASIRAHIPHPIHNEDDLLDHRGCQISLSILGHNRAIDEKEACDPQQRIRKQLLALCPLTSDSVEVRIAGTTCFDYFARGKNKGYNVRRLIDYYGWDSKRCIYFGDALFPGGNDETVIGVIDTQSVQDYLETYSLLKFIDL